MQLPLDAIDEDPEQPRQAFDEQALAELAHTISERGVRQPVSVRAHPQQPGRWMLNFGARRLRASRLAGLAEIPAFVDHTANSVDQFIENEQRKGLTPLEIALFVQRALARGETQADIARAIGKSRQYVMIATALIDPPDWLMAAYREGRCRGMNELHELRKLHAAHPERLQTWAADQPSFTRDTVACFKAQLEQGEPAPGATSSATSPAVPEPASPSRVKPPMLAPGKPKAATPTTEINETTEPPSLLARLDEALVRVVTTSIPPAEGCVYV